MSEPLVKEHKQLVETLEKWRQELKGVTDVAKAQKVGDDIEAYLKSSYGGERFKTLVKELAQDAAKFYERIGRL